MPTSKQQEGTMTEQIVDALIRKGVIPEHHRQDAVTRLEWQLKRRTRQVVRNAARAAVLAAAQN